MTEPATREIPAGKVLFAEYRELDDSNRAVVTQLAEAWGPDVRAKVQLVRSSPGFECAGSVARWTNGYWAVFWWNSSGARMGQRYADDADGEAKARAHFLKLTPPHVHYAAGGRYDPLPNGPHRECEVCFKARELEIAGQAKALETPERLEILRARWAGDLAKAQATVARLQSRKPFAKARSSRAQREAENEVRCYAALVHALTLPAEQRDGIANLDILSALEHLADGTWGGA